jgi:hypothetical protein
MNPAKAASAKRALLSLARRVRLALRAYRKVYAFGAFVLGVGLMVAGGVISGLGDYSKAIFVNAGTAMALFGPLLLLERQLDRRITDVGRQADRAGERARIAERQVGDLAERVRAELEQDRARDRDLRERAGTGGSQADLVALYDRAAEYGSIDRAGLRLPAPGLFEIWMRIRVVHREEEGVPIGLLEFSVEDLNVRPIGETVLWSPGQPAEGVFVQLARNLQQAGAWQGDKAFNPLAMLGAFAEALGRIIDIWSGPGANPQLRPVSALLDSDWAVTRMGLDSLKTPDVFAEGYELVGDTHHAFMRMEHQVKTFGWDEMEFRMAFAEAERVHEAFARESPVGE